MEIIIIFKTVSDFSEGLAAVSICSAELPTFTTCKWGFMDEKGKEIIKPQYIGMKGFYAGVTHFKEGIAGVNMGDSSFKMQWGFIANPLNGSSAGEMARK